ncbi:MAG: VWA domain-containing protein [Desulfamplus sp.]|nr:VWA domain-containing protein [Desulfamplus sp.]
MLDTMIEFTACCRSYGLRVSTSEVLDCVRHICLVDPLDEKEFKTVLQSNYAKSRRDQSRFNSLYNLFFHGIKPLDSVNSFTHLSSTFNKIMDMMEKNQSNDPVEKALAEFMRGKPAQFLDQVHKLNIMSVKNQKFFKSNMDQLSAKLGIMLVINQMRQRITKLAGTHLDNLDQESIRLLNQHFTKLLNNAYALLTDEPRENNDSLVERKSVITTNAELGQKSFSSLSNLEVAKVMEIIELFARKLQEQASRRFRIKRKGTIDIKKTLRNSGKYQGVPLDIKFRDKPKNRSSLVILCDISGSVWSSARFMLNILYALQDCFTRVKSFVFVAQLVEVTSLLERGSLNQFNKINVVDGITQTQGTIDQDTVAQGANAVNTAINTILNSNIINTSEHTDYGAALSSFKKNHPHILNHKTTLIIMGDGRSNYLNPQANILAEIREKCKRVIWLNPEPYNTWNSGDSEIFAYKPHCHEIRTCMNLNHLTQFVKELVL